MNAESVQMELRAREDPERAAFLQGFFKTGKGEYGEGDLFRGIRVPELRRIAARFKALPLDESLLLLRSPMHEDRFVALAILVHAYRRGDAQKKKAVYTAYIGHTRWINSWDLVDASAHKIVGPYLAERDRSVLAALAASGSLWERRIAIMATLHFIKAADFGDTLALAERLLRDGEPLIQKAVGWMLREVGKRDQALEERFLKKHYRDMPRTMLRYAIERFDKAKRKAYLEGAI